MERFVRVVRSGRPSRRLATAALVLAVVWLLPGPKAVPTTPSRSAAARTALAADAAKPFGLPFAEPPGLSTWYLAQPFGNTAYAYFERRSIYGAGQGFHMGLDFAAACGTPVVAIGEGTVLSIDGRGGSLPHNLMIDHHNGYVSLYGHLLEKPGLTEGQPVAKGEVIAKSGDMYATCYSSPHLHLEIRDRGLNRLHNPATLIDADWNSLLLLGDSPVFEVDLDTPRKWQSMEDQPTIQIGGPLLNDYAHAWPSDNR